jgi:hypothetical protein
MLDDPWAPIGRYGCTDDMWHGPCFLYWFGSGIFIGFSHTLALRLVEIDRLSLHGVGRRFLTLIAAAIDGTLDDVAMMTGNAYPSTIAVMFRNAADAQFILAAGSLPGIGGQRWVNGAMGRRSRGFKIELDSQLSLRDLYRKAALSGEITSIWEKELLGPPTVDRPMVDRPMVDRTELRYRYVIRYRTAAGRVRGFQNPPEYGAINIKAFNLKDVEEDIQPPPLRPTSITLAGNKPQLDSPYRPWSIYDWVIASVAAWIKSSAYRWAKGRIRDHERFLSLAASVLAYEGFLAMDLSDQLRFDVERRSRFDLVVPFVGSSFSCRCIA